MHMKLTAHKMVTGISAALCAALLLTGCSDLEESGDAAQVSQKERGSSWQAEKFEKIYDQNIDWTDCNEDDGFDDDMASSLEEVGVDPDTISCAFIEAPLDWNDPKNTETIDVAVVHIPATGDGEKLGTLVGNPGGPGVTGVDFMLGMPLSPGFESVLENYDLLGFDPRGIGQSTPIDCDGAGSDLAVVQLGECIAENPLTHTMGTTEVARDMELMRHLMDEERLDYLGYSYGTMLGATYASIFPERVGKMVLDSAENAEWASPIHNYDQQVAIANALVALATSCRTEYEGDVEVCPFDSEESLLGVIAKLNAEPLRATDGTIVTGKDLYWYLTQTLYSGHYERGRVLDTIAIALFGDQEAIDLIADEAGSDAPDPNAPPTPEVVGGWGQDLPMGIVTCHSFPIEPDIPGLLAHIDDVGVPKLLGGPEVSDEVLAPFVDLSCYTLPESGLDYSETFDAPSADPILVIGITGDHATPFQYAQVLADELGNARLLTLDGQGHAASYSDRSTCVDDAVTKYLLKGKLPKEGTVCTDDA